jgi:hypothetical protein
MRLQREASRVPNEHQGIAQHKQLVRGVKGDSEVVSKGHHQLVRGWFKDGADGLQDGLRRNNK